MATTRELTFSYSSKDLGQNFSAIAITRDGQRLYVSFQDHVSIFDTATHKVIADIPVKPNPSAIKIAPGEKVVCVEHRDNTFSVIATATYEVLVTLKGQPLFE
jgi:YVTN family beta-propeller protein